MGLETSLTSKTWNPFDGSTYVNTDQIEFDYSTLGFTPSSGDSYKSTSGDIFKVYVGGVRIYRTNDSSYASGTGFLEDGDTTTGLNGVSATWSDTSNTVWTIDTANQLITIDTGEILATNLYKNSGIYPSGSGNSNITFTSSTIIEVRRSTQNESSPSVDFSNASILTEQDLDNSSLNVFHMAQQAVVVSEKGLSFNSGTGVYEAYQPGTTTRKKITQVADATSDYDAVNYGQFSPNIENIGIVAGISGDVTTVAGIAADVTAVKNDASDIGKVAAVDTEIGRLGTSDMSVGTDAYLKKLGDDAFSNASSGYLKKVSTIDANITKVANIDTNVTKVADIDGNVTKVADVDDKVTDLAAVDGEITLLGTEAMAHATTGHLARLGTSDMAHASTGHLAKLAATGVIDDIETVADIDDKVTIVAGLGTDGVDVTTVAGIDTEVVAVAGQITPTNNISTLSTNIGNINLIGDDLGGDYSNIFDGGAITDSDVTGSSGTSKVSTVAGSITNVNTVATNIADVNNFADVYQIDDFSPSAPTTDGGGNAIAAGDLAYDSTANTLKYYNGSGFVAINEGDITGVTAGTGLTGGGTDGAVTVNVVGGTGITANANDIAIDSTVTTLTGSQTLTNKTLTSPTLTTPDLGTPSAMMLDFGSLT